LFTLSSFLSPSQCRSLIKTAENVIKFPTPTFNPGTKHTAFRNNHRISFNSTEWASSLYKLLAPFLTNLEVTIPATSNLTSKSKSNKQHQSDVKVLKPVGLNDHIRIYKYTPTQSFAAHYDDFDSDSNGRKTYYTLLLYLSDESDGLIGGETVFYLDESKRKDESKVVVKPEKGMVLIHLHGDECLLHESVMVEKGLKYVLRSDIVF
ncbi:hypothetical protein BKA69DRAFT_1021003, partial [Paraphysoderma sedebokerense]